MTIEEREAAFSHALDDLFDRWDKDEYLAGDTAAPNGIFPDGRYYDWDEALKATVETAPDGRRYVVQFRQGQLMRIREVLPAA